MLFTGCYKYTIAAAMLLVAIAPGCIRDRAGECEPVQVCRLTVRAYDNTGAELGPDEVESVRLYYFDGGRYYAGSAEAGVGETVELDVEPGEELHIVAWGNLSERMLTVDGDRLDGFGVGLRPLTRAEFYAAEPDDVFYGGIAVKATGSDGDFELPIGRKVGSLSVTVEGLKAFTGTADGEYGIEVGDTFSMFGFDGEPGGPRVSYRPAGSFTDPDRYRVEPTNMFPGESVEISIRLGDTPVATVDRNGDGEPIAVKAGETTHVRIDFRGSGGDPGNLDVSVALTPWGEEYIWKEF